MYDTFIYNSRNLYKVLNKDKLDQGEKIYNSRNLYKVLNPYIIIHILNSSFLHINFNFLLHFSII